MRRLHLVLGCFVVGLSTVALLVGPLRMGWSPRMAIVLAFFAGVIYAGVLMVRANWKNEREHETKATTLIDRVKDAPARAPADPPPPSERSGGADPGDDRR